MATEARSVFTILVHDRPGVLTKIAAAFYRRGVNINTLTVGPTAEVGCSEMVIGSAAPRSLLERIAAAIDNQVDVLSVRLE